MTKTRSNATRARYTLEFKLKAVRMIDKRESIAAAARSLGVVDQTLFNWDKLYKAGKLQGADSKSVSAEKMEISRLRAELALVKMERDILGKVTAAQAACAEPVLTEVRLHSGASAGVADLGAMPRAGGQHRGVSRALCEACQRSPAPSPER